MSSSPRPVRLAALGGSALLTLGTIVLGSTVLGTGTAAADPLPSVPGVPSLPSLPSLPALPSSPVNITVSPPTASDPTLKVGITADGSSLPGLPGLPVLSLPSPPAVPSLPGAPNALGGLASGGTLTITPPRSPLRVTVTTPGKEGDKLGATAGLGNNVGVAAMIDADKKTGDLALCLSAATGCATGQAAGGTGATSGSASGSAGGSASGSAGSAAVGGSGTAQVSGAAGPVVLGAGDTASPAGYDQLAHTGFPLLAGVAGVGLLAAGTGLRRAARSPRHAKATGLVS